MFNQQNGNNLNNLNSFIEQASQLITCDSECQKNKASNELKHKYLAAKDNLVTAPIQVQVAQKNYVIFANGELAYNELHEEELKQKAKLISEKFVTNFEDKISDIKTKNEIYTGVLVNFKNVVDLYKKYKKENITLFKELKDNTSDILTNERKTYYEDQGIERLDFFYRYIFFIVYIIFVIGFIILSFIYPSTVNWKTKLGITIGLIILPFISTWILAFIIRIIYNIYDMIPKNIHLTV